MRQLGGRLRVRAALFLGVGLGLTGLVLMAYGANLFEPWEADTVNARFSIRGEQEPPPELVTVLIETETFDAIRDNPETRLQAQYPFTRTFHARVLDRLREDGVGTVVYDIEFADQTPGEEGALADNALIEAVEKLRGKITLSATEVADNGEVSVLGGHAVLRQIGARVGNGTFVPDEDGVVRRVPYAHQGLESLSLTGAELALGHRIAPSSLPNDPAWIDFVGPQDTIPSVEFSKVLFGQTPKGFFRDKIVVIGAGAAVLQDLHETSTTSGNEQMPGPELQANALATALRGFPLSSPGSWFDILLIVLCGVIVPLAGLRLSLRGTLFFAIGATIVLVVGTQLAFLAGWVIPFIYPALALVLSTIGALAAYYVLSIFERQRTRDTFARFVPESVVDELLAQGGGAGRLATTQVFGTCMFTDIRGFTTFSEGHEAPDVIDVLNRYLAEMSEAILRQGGTLASFLGDGFMAVFGAPIAQDDHADRALAAAREIVEVRLPRFNAQLRSEGFPGFNMGIGLNSGPFMSGNVGSEQRLQYTVIGDTINTASRIEGLTKGSGHIIFLADSTREALVSPPADLVYVDEFDIRGRQSRVKLWSIEGRPVEDAGPAPEGVAAAKAGA